MITTTSQQKSKSRGRELLFNKFSCYILPGRVSDPNTGLKEALDAEEFGLGAVWISERYAVKEPAVLSGAISQITSKIDIAGTMFATMRNPIVTASVANTMQAISNNRFRLLLAKGVPSHLNDMGSPAITFQRLADFIPMLRSLWTGETLQYEGILGKFPELVLTDRYEGPTPPIIMTAIGEKSLAFAGQHCDGVLIHPFITTDGLKKSVNIVRQSAEKSGRDPDSVKIYQVVIVAPELQQDDKEAIVDGRAVTYFQIPQLGEMICEINGWDKRVLDQVRNHALFTDLGDNLAEQKFSREQLVEVSRVIPQEWLSTGAAAGTLTHCTSTLCDFIDAGADEILLHGTTPDKLKPMTDKLIEVLPSRYN
ncbi:MAG: TIGR03857 family LLM class F420-dependent oxidoreductase [Porticoccaceae bacterium]|nr:TIGR03857 family LLM class F420-dependent oxidoreductase [Porticoccaceae bacterium]